MAGTSGLLHVVRFRVLGVLFLCLLVFMGWLTYAIFNKTFTNYDKVALKTSTIGLQLPSRADVKVRGVIVGEVLERKSDGQGATLTLGLYPDKVALIPANVTADIVPKTLFGEKYVSLKVPSTPDQAHLAAGDTIEQTHVSIEVEKVLRDFYPLLRTVQPEQLNYTLNALATALDGRGEAIGENLETLDGYLKRQNPQLPGLVEDLRLLSSVSDTYADVVPQLASTLRNSLVTASTLETKDAKVRAFFDDVTGFASTTRDFLQANGDNIIRLGDVSTQQLAVFARYAPEYPCLLNSIVKVAPRQAEAFRNKVLHINLEPLPRQPRGYGPQDAPRYGATNSPHLVVSLCDKVQAGFWNQHNLPPDKLIPNFDDGVDEPTGKGHSPNRAATRYDVTSGYAGTRAEQGLVDAVAAPMLGIDQDKVDDLTALLFAPLARGTEVTLR